METTLPYPLLDLFGRVFVHLLDGNTNWDVLLIYARFLVVPVDLQQQNNLGLYYRLSIASLNYKPPIFR